jgi:chromosome segregation ATPase
MKSGKAPLWLLLALLAVLAGAVIFGIAQFRRAADERAAVTRLEEENRRLKASPAISPAPAPVVEESHGAEASHGGRRQPSEAEIEARLDSVRMLGQVKDQLAVAKTSIAELQARVHELEATAVQAGEESKRRAAAETELRESLASANRVVEAMQTELKGKTERLAAVETASRRTSEDMKAANDKIEKMTAWSREFEDLNRRREGYLTNLMRRYRDLTDQVRAMTIRLDNPQEGARSQVVDLPRLQNVVQLAEEDLRQLASLNSQAARLAKKLKE